MNSKIILFRLKFFQQHVLLVLSSSQNEEWDTASIRNENKYGQDLAINFDIVLGIEKNIELLG